MANLEWWVCYRFWFRDFFQDTSHHKIAHVQITSLSGQSLRQHFYSSHARLCKADRRKYEWTLVFVRTERIHLFYAKYRLTTGRLVPNVR